MATATFAERGISLGTPSGESTPAVGVQLDFIRTHGRSGDVPRAVAGFQSGLPAPEARAGFQSSLPRADSRAQAGFNSSLPTAEGKAGFNSSLPVANTARFNSGLPRRRG